MSIEEYLVEEGPLTMKFKIPNGFGHTTYYSERDDEGYWDVYRSGFLGRDEYVDRCYNREDVYDVVRRDADI